MKYILKYFYILIKNIILNSFIFNIYKCLLYIIFISKKNNKNSNNLLLNIELINPNRRYFQIISQFLYCGYSCYIDISFYNFLKSDSYGIKALKLDRVYKKNRNENYSIIISDNKKYLNSINNNLLKIYIEFNIFNHLDDVNENDFFWPISSHINYNFPKIEENILSKSLVNERKIGAIFAGNVNEKSYNNNITNILFNVYTRYELYNFIKRNIPENNLYIPKNLKTFLKDKENGYLKNKIVIIDTSKIKIPANIYFYILLDSLFYIHTCGTLYPYCHNQIESMMAGCIPITQFNNFYKPSLIHENNCLSYKTLDELIIILNKISENKYNNIISKMNSNIHNYYISHYSFISFNNKLLLLLNNKIKYSKYYIVTYLNESMINELLNNKNKFEKKEV